MFSFQFYKQTEKNCQKKSRYTFDVYSSLMFFLEKVQINRTLKHVTRGLGVLKQWPISYGKITEYCMQPNSIKCSHCWRWNWIDEKEIITYLYKNIVLLSTIAVEYFCQSFIERLSERILMEKWQTCTKVTDFFVYILRLLLLKFIAATSLWKYIRSNFHCFFFLACLSVLTTQCYIWFHYQKKIDFDCLALAQSVL